MFVRRRRAEMKIYIPPPVLSTPVKMAAHP